MLENQDAKEAFVAGLDTTNPDLVINTGDNLSSKDGVPAVIRSLNDLSTVPAHSCSALTITTHRGR